VTLFMHTHLNVRLRLLSLVIALTPIAAKAQDSYAYRESAGSIGVFAGYANVQTDFDSSVDGAHDRGFQVGVNYNFSRSLRTTHLTPSFEARGTFSPGSNVNMGTGLFGPRIETSIFHRFHPYADVFVGFGNIDINKQIVPGYYHDDSFIQAVGGGLDVDLVLHLEAKMDYQREFWQFQGSTRFEPATFAIGLGYRFPLRKR